VKAHAGAGYRVKIGDLCDQVEPTARAIREGLGFIYHILGIAAVEKGGQVHLWAWPPCQTTYRPTDTCKGCGVVVRAGQAHGDPERQSTRADAVTREPAEIGSLDQGKPVPPSFWAALQPVIQRADTTCGAGETRGMARLCLPPIVEDFGFTRFGPWSRRQIIRLLFHWTGQEPKIVFRRLFHLLTVEDESIILIM
jgi:hypothetical protein